MLNSRKQRSHLYAYTFLKWSVDKIVQTLEKQAIELSLASHEFLVSPGESTYLKLCEKISDVETIAEVCEDSFPSMRSNIDKIKKDKLISLKRRPKHVVQDDNPEHEMSEEEFVNLYRPTTISGHLIVLRKTILQFFFPKMR